MSNPAKELINFGQSVWYDNISREILDNGALRTLIEDWGVRGLTSNPTIFDQAINSSDIYDQSIAALKGKSADEVFEEIAIKDIADAADLLLPIYEQSKGDDGFVSIEVSPLLADNTAGTIEAGKRIFERLNRPNIMIKVPGTEEGLPAIKSLLEEGINVNVTLLFSVSNYEAVAKTYCEALENRRAKGQPIDKVRSVASFFVSRVDAACDQFLTEVIASNPERAELAKSLLGQFGIVNSKLAYQSFLEIFNSDSFVELKKDGAVVQRPLWASTSTKNPEYRDVLYVEELIGLNTVNTVPHHTLEAFVDHGVCKETINTNIESAKQVPGQLESLGLDIEGLLVKLQTDGVTKFVDSFIALNKAIESKL